MKRQWTHDELTEHWTLLPDELKLLANKTGATRLGFVMWTVVGGRGRDKLVVEQMY